MVVLSRPLEELEERGIQYRPGIEHFQDGFQALRRHIRRIALTCDYSHHAPPAEGNPDACPACGRRRSCAWGRRQVVKKAPQRGIERHPEDFGHRALTSG